MAERIANPSYAPMMAYNSSADRPCFDIRINAMRGKHID
jgi:hypothetical protein